VEEKSGGLTPAATWNLTTKPKMKSAYELAMERLNKTAPTVKLSTVQKKEIAELESEYGAKIAAREIALKGEMASVAGDVEKESALRDHLATDRKKLQAELEDKKERVRQGASK
jgi:hypothetical protein